MSKNLLVIYEKSGEEWSIYLKDLLTSHLQIDDVFLYDVSNESNEVVLGFMWQCKLLILTRDILKIFYKNQSTSFLQLLQPSHRVVLMLCGVNSPEGFYELFPFERDCYVILPDQDPQEYISIVSTVMNEDHDDSNIKPSEWATESASWRNVEQEDVKTAAETSIVVLPKRVTCENPDELFIILSKEIPKNSEVEVEFCTQNQLIRKKPTWWSEKILYLTSPNFPPGEVIINLFCGEVKTASTQIEFFSTAEELRQLLLKTIDPVSFICQAFNVYTLEDLDKVLVKSLKNKISSCSYNLPEFSQHKIGGSPVEIPTLLHCAAKLGLKEVAKLLMQIPAANNICRITNKYGDDPATMAEKYGHGDIQDIIHQLSKKTKADQSDISGEPLEFEQEDVYVDMVESADHETVDPLNETEKDAQVYVVEENLEEHEENHVEYSVSEKILDITDDYCLLIPAENPSGHFKTANPYLKDKPYKTVKEEERFISEHSSKDMGDWQHTKCDQNSKCPHENIYAPLPVQYITEDLPGREYHQDLTESLPPEQDLSMHRGCFYEDDVNKRDMSQEACDEFSEEQTLNEHDEEPVLIASTEDDLYIIFENSIKDTQIGQKPFITHNLASLEDSSTPTIASGTAYGSGERTDDNELPCGDLDDYSGERNDHEHDEEPLVVASTEDDMYILFETSIKNKQRGQTSFIPHKPAPPEATSNSTMGSDSSYIAQAEGIDERFNAQLFWDECENNEEDPYSFIYNDDDELYIELPYETTDGENPRERKSFIVHRAPAPAPRPQTAVPAIEDSYISRVFRQKEEEKKIYGTGLYQDKVQFAKREPPVPEQQYAHTGQDELILLQEKVKMGIISMDEALQKFQQWQNEKSGLDLLQQKKLQQLRDNIIGNKTDDERVYDKITIVHQPNALPGKKRTNHGMFDNSIYQKPNKPPRLPTPYHPVKKDNDMTGKLPYSK
ncbi:B-cell scaffold protein with ankyrin repeats isoform X1 [Engystomops pustulosus]|uniref:B-cell scaffold protein with ankyrin repeats isoform X1 n=1 Tax=Engystomops pustulosus TaxID=76066 RepID=UPI003AFA860F